MVDKVFMQTLPATVFWGIQLVSFSLIVSCGGATHHQLADSLSPVSGLFFGGKAPNYVGGPFEVLGDSASHPDSTEVYVGALDGHHVIKTRTMVIYGSIVRDCQLNLETGVVSIAQENPYFQGTLTPPSGHDGNYFEYSRALTEIAAAVTKVRSGSDVVPHVSPPHPELDDTIRYINYIQTSLTQAPFEAVYLNNPPNVKPAGSYDVSVSSKALAVRNIVLNFQCGDTVIATGEGLTQKGVGQTTVTIDLPDTVAPCRQARFVVTLTAALQTSPHSLATYSRNISLLPSNVIEDIFTHAATELGDKACWFRLVYATTGDTVLRVSLLGRDLSEIPLVVREYPLVPGDGRTLDVLFMLPDQMKLEGYEKLRIAMIRKDGSKVFSVFTVYAENARA